MKKILFCILLLLSFLLFSCEKKSNQLEEPAKKYGLALFIGESRGIEKDLTSPQTSYWLTDKKVETCTLKKNQLYLFQFYRAYSYNDDFDYNITYYPDTHNIVYEPSILEVTHVACYIDDPKEAWRVDSVWGNYYVQNKKDVEDASIAFYCYPFLLEVNLHFE